MAVVTDSLIAEWVGKLAKTGTAPGNNADPTSTWDDLKGTHDGTITNGSTWTAAHGWAGAGTTGDPYRLVNDGAYPTTTVADQTDLNSSVFSIEAWVNLTAVNATLNQSVFNCRGDTGTLHQGYSLAFLATQDYPKLGIGNGTAYTYVAAAGSCLTGWHHVVFVYNGSTVTPYFDGSGQSPTSYSTYAPKTGTSVCLLISPGAFDKLNGSVPTVRVYSDALTSGEVAQNYAAGILAASTDAAGPTLTTTAITAITTTTASSGGTLRNPDALAITDRGVCWNTGGAPTIADSHTSD